MPTRRSFAFPDGAPAPKVMPVILHDDDEARRLSVPMDEALTLATSYLSQLMTAAL